ncbi:MAG: acyl-CoA dehydratase activase [Bacteroidales bacterium]|jgi:predicted CoA-substrate-specific enzyme activase
MIHVGIDIGSTTVKIAAISPTDNKLLYKKYVRHHSLQVRTLIELLDNFHDEFRSETCKVAICGSGGKPIAEKLRVPFIQEVVANANAVCYLYPETRTAIELGGQDAKVIFFYRDEHDGQPKVSDMRMNGNCAGGTGAFIDEIAQLLDVQTSEFDALAAQASRVYDISGRCGVFAKTDIQPLLIQGAAHADIALSTFHAIAKQTIGGLSQGLEITPPIIFEGGPLTFNKQLVRVFVERLQLKGNDIIVPKYPEIIVAYGAALSIDRLQNDKTDNSFTIDELLKKLRNIESEIRISTNEPPFFDTEKDYAEFAERHDKELRENAIATPQNGILDVYLGIDSGSTTSKFVLINEEEQVIERFYAPNLGKPLDVLKRGLTEVYGKYKKQGIELNVKGFGSTGYGELMTANALGADYHIVETVAHAQAALHYYPDTTFLLDIGGQDMKAIWIDNGVITNIMLNEACSSGCGSFLENFAVTMKIPVEEIGAAAFRSTSPAKLGSRCTVFMTSSIVTEQRNGKSPDDIMAGLCRSIIENVFTKVVRINNTDSLGNKIVVQGGTFRNRAVLRAFEEYLGKEVRLAPYPGEMGAVGVALLTKQHIEKLGCVAENSSNFIGFDELKSFDYVTESGVPCPHCANHCLRTIIRFPKGKAWVTGNKCERGAELTDGKKDKKLKVKKTERSATDLFSKRARMLFEPYPCENVSNQKREIVGLPRTLEFWNSMPFWSTFFKALGFKTLFSNPSDQEIYEKGLQFVASDTICFPAKMVHGHIENLAEKGVDRVFLPYVMHLPPEGVDKLSPYVCSIIMGYSMVVRNTQDPAKRHSIHLDTPIFHWFSEKDRIRQICDFAVESLNVSRKEAKQAYLSALNSMTTFKTMLRSEAERLIQEAERANKTVIVLAGRPYHSDPFISHNVTKFFIEKGLSVIPVDALPGLEEVDLRHTNIEITNNFHTRMLAGAVIAAQNPALEYVQLVSFGCGHDAVLSDEIVRIMKCCGNKSPLILKIDESEASGSLRIRIQSFIETITNHKNSTIPASTLPAPNPVKFYKKDKQKRTVLIPNISAEMMILMDAILEKKGFRVQRVPVGGKRQISLGKKYVHNDICFPCQMVIGELIAALQDGNYRSDEVAVGMVKFQCDCRLSHYAGLLRKGLDAAGFNDVPIITTDVNDTKENNPGITLLSLPAIFEVANSFMMLDIINELCRKIRPYELRAGDTDQWLQKSIRSIAKAINDGILAARETFKQCINELKHIKYNRERPKPRVFVTGELLVTYHPGSNFNIERYLEKTGMETIFPRFTDQLRKDFLAQVWQKRDFKADVPRYPYLVTWLFNNTQRSLENIAVAHPLFQKTLSPAKLYEDVKEIIPGTLSCGEGWLMAADIMHYAKQGVTSHIILQPFGCLPNHVCGRGVIKKLKECCPDISILPLDLDPDTSYANIENRLQMLIMNMQYSTKNAYLCK